MVRSEQLLSRQPVFDCLPDPVTDQQGGLGRSAERVYELSIKEVVAALDEVANNPVLLIEVCGALRRMSKKPVAGDQPPARACDHKGEDSVANPGALEVCTFASRIEDGRLRCGGTSDKQEAVGFGAAG